MHIKLITMRTSEINDKMMRTSDNFDPSLVISRVWSGWGLAGNRLDLTVGLGVGNTYWAGIGAATSTLTEK